MKFKLKTPPNSLFFLSLLARALGWYFLLRNTPTLTHSVMPRNQGVLVQAGLCSCRHPYCVGHLTSTVGNSWLRDLARRLGFKTCVHLGSLLEGTRKISNSGCLYAERSLKPHQSSSDFSASQITAPGFLTFLKARVSRQPPAGAQPGSVAHSGLLLVLLGHSEPRGARCSFSSLPPDKE